MAAADVTNGTGTLADADLLEVVIGDRMNECFAYKH